MINKYLLSSLVCILFYTAQAHPSSKLPQYNIINDLSSLIKNIENKPVQAGTSSKEGGAITLNNWKNVVAYEVENENGELVYVVNALERPYGFTVPSWKDSYKVYAVSAAQGRIEVTFNK